LVDAIKHGTPNDIKEELGDVLLHVTMLSAIAEEDGAFTLDDVADFVRQKMVRRHPHVFGDTTVSSVEEVWVNWEAIKKKEKQASLFASIPRTLPALLKAFKLQKKAARTGFDFPDTLSTLEKLEEEIKELKVEIASTPQKADRIQDEAGDILFSLVNVLRKLDINPEDALEAANQKFTDRFNLMESKAASKEKEISDLSPGEMNQLWETTKTLL